MSAFRVNCQAAYEQLQKWVLQEGQWVNTYFADIRRLCSICSVVELLVDRLLVRNGCLVAPKLVGGADAILVFDIIKRWSGIVIGEYGSVSWGCKPFASAVTSRDKRLIIADQTSRRYLMNSWVEMAEWGGAGRIHQSLCSIYSATRALGWIIERLMGGLSCMILKCMMMLALSH